MSVSKKQTSSKTAIAKKKGGKQGAPITSVGVVHIQSTHNNTIITCANQRNQTVFQASGGTDRTFKNARKSTGEAAEVAARKVGEYVKTRGMGTIAIRLKGAGQGGKEGAVRGLVLAGLTVSTISDVTGIPHNGVKKKKRQRK
jgi:small subunit ribosomal protein S11